MAEVTIRFRYNPATGKRELLIEYESERDALPHEHERDHRALTEQLLGMPLGDDIESVQVRRAGQGERAPEEPAREQPVTQREPTKQGGG